MKQVFVILSLFAALGGTAQGIHFTDFAARQYNGDVVLNWTVGQGSNTCSDVVVQRSVADSGFRNIYVVPGICGNTGADEHYSFTDSFPVDFKKHDYRLLIGSTGELTDTVSIFYIPYRYGGFVNDPELIFNESRFYFDPSLNISFTFELYDLAGRIWHRREDFTGAEYTLRAPSGPGMYVVKVYPEGYDPIVAQIFLLRN